MSDKTLHVVAYFLLAGFFLLTLIARGKPRPRRIILVVAVMAVYGAFDELTQPIVNRTAAWGDWFADVAGTILAIVIIEIVLLLKRRSSSAHVSSSCTWAGLS